MTDRRFVVQKLCYTYGQKSPESEPGTFEISIVWDEEKQEPIAEKIKQLG
ncbi:hypothetical protein [Brevibacillus parabrevis]|nr:hypothetical protein [Brevibacillus parabrevis]MED1723986.1 hypothetical protein [Brevibacillus parabrevis]